MTEYQLIIPAGGKGLRIQDVTNKEYHKAMLPLPTGETLIKRMLLQYHKAGVRKFVVLTGDKSDKLMEHVEDSELYEHLIDFDVRYSEDPKGTKPGNAGAILNALRNGTIDETMPAIIHNPDDLILTKGYPDMFMKSHNKNMIKNAFASVVLVPSTKYQYSSAMIDGEQRISAIKKYPDVQIPTHVGVSLFSPNIYDLFHEYINLEIASSFEDVILPRVVEFRGLFCIMISKDDWISINDGKGYNLAKEALMK